MSYDVSPLFFIHIPKTAGTSFRKGAEDYFSMESILYDYGEDSGVTSHLIRQYMYGVKVNVWGLGLALLAQKAAMIGGHVNCNRYVSMTGVMRTLTFLREPLQRMISEYEHFRRNYGYKDSFKQFYSRPVMHNRQSKILHGVDVEALGFVGITERYESSLQILNAKFGIDIPRRMDNQGKATLDSVHEIEADDEAALKEMNKLDIALYKNAVDLFDLRHRFFLGSKRWAHARLVEASTQRISGWAWWADGGNDPVVVEVWVNDVLAGTTIAVDLRPGLAHLRIPRGAYVGFHFAHKLAVGDCVKCRVAETGQWFPSSPRVVPEAAAK
jgi:hypothetical protein